MNTVKLTSQPATDSTTRVASAPKAAVISPKAAVKVVAKPVVVTKTAAVLPPAKKTVPVKAAKTKGKAEAEVKPKPKPKTEKVVTETAAIKSALAEKPKKLKLVRDSFTMPKAEIVVLSDLKQRALNLKTAVKKSELLRAGIKALAAMDEASFLSCLQAVPALKTGRPKQ
jgi:hypothetical protein